MRVSVRRGQVNKASCRRVAAECYCFGRVRSPLPRAVRAPALPLPANTGCETRRSVRATVEIADDRHRPLLRPRQRPTHAAAPPMAAINSSAIDATSRNDEPAGQSKIAVQAPTSGETCRSFQRMPPCENGSGKGFHVSWSIWTYSSFVLGFMVSSFIFLPQRANGPRGLNQPMPNPGTHATFLS
jgi:hypothetical protein